MRIAPEPPSEIKDPLFAATALRHHAMTADADTVFQCSGKA
jgi:hypothetical protein